MHAQGETQAQQMSTWRCQRASPLGRGVALWRRRRRRESRRGQGMRNRRRLETWPTAVPFATIAYCRIARHAPRPRGPLLTCALPADPGKKPFLRATHSHCACLSCFSVEVRPAPHGRHPYLRPGLSWVLYHALQHSHCPHCFARRVCTTAAGASQPIPSPSSLTVAPLAGLTLAVLAYTL